MFGLPFEAMEFIVSGALGAFTTYHAVKAKADANRQELIIKGLAARNGATIDLNASVNASPFMAMTRRILAFGALFILAFVMIGGYFAPEVVVNVAREIKTGGSYLFGLIDTTNTEIVYEKLKGIVILPWFSHVVIIVFGTYFGSSIVKV